MNIELKLNKVKLAELEGFINAFKKGKLSFMDLVGDQIRNQVQDYVSKLVEIEFNNHMNRDKYERVKVKTDKPNYRNGSYRRKLFLKSIGESELTIPRDRSSTFKSDIVPKFQRNEQAIKEDLSLMYLTGISTRSLSMLSKRLIGKSISPQEVTNANKELREAVEKWRMRDLSPYNVKYMYIDGVNFPMRIENRIQLVPVLVAIGVDEFGYKFVLSFQSGDKECASSWREFFKDLKQRGLQSSFVTLGIMDGLPALEKTFKEEFINAKVQRCQVHLSKNILSKVTRKEKGHIADDLRSIFYASTKEKALKFYEDFTNKYTRDFPSAVKTLQRSLQSALTFFDFPIEDWISIKTTNVIERLNKEFKRRTKSMEILAGESSCYNLLAFISLKMESYWATNPIGRFTSNLPSLKRFYEFTQNC